MCWRCADFQHCVSSDWGSLLLCILSALCYIDVLQGLPPHVWVLVITGAQYCHMHICSLVFFAGVFSGLLAFGYLFTCQFSSLSLQMWGFRSAAPCPAPHLSYFSPHHPFFPPFPSFFILCLSSFWTVSLNIVSSLELHLPGCVLLLMRQQRHSSSCCPVFHRLAFFFILRSFLLLCISCLFCCCLALNIRFLSMIIIINSH